MCREHSSEEAFSVVKLLVQRTPPCIERSLINCNNILTRLVLTRFGYVFVNLEACFCHFYRAQESLFGQMHFVTSGCFGHNG